MRQGYAEAKVHAGEWKTRGRMNRSWHRVTARPQGLTGKHLDAWIERMASKYPSNVTVH